MHSTTAISALLVASAYVSPFIQPRAIIVDLPVISEAKNGTSLSNSTALGTAATNSSIVLPDGRIQQAVVATDFNALASVFKSAVVKGDGTKLFF